MIEREILNSILVPATIETRRAVVDLATSHFDLQLAVVENSNIPTHEESVVRLYDVGQIRSEEDEAEDDDNDGDEGEEDDSDDGDGKRAPLLSEWHGVEM